MKTFTEFLEEATSWDKYPHFPTKEALISHYKGIPDWAYPKQRTKGWGLTPKSSSKEAKQRRRERENPLTTSDFHDYAKRNLIPNPREFADIAIDRERYKIKQLKNERDRRNQRFRKDGIAYELEHSQPLSQEERQERHRTRFYRIAPAHSAQNLDVRTKKYNSRKGDTPPKKGERGSNFTRSGAIKYTADDTERFIKDFDSLVKSVQDSPAKRMAQAYDRHTGLSPKK